MSISKMLCSSLSEQRSETEAALPKAEGPLSRRPGGHERPILGGKQTLRQSVLEGILLRMKHPEAQYVVEVTVDDEIVCRAPKQAEQRIKMTDLAAVYVETNGDAPWGADVWWLLNDSTGQTKVAFPQLATGETEALARLQQLPGFATRGMNSTDNARFECWPSPVE